MSLCGFLHLNGYVLNERFHVRELAAVSIHEKEPPVHVTFKVEDLPRSVSDIQSADFMLKCQHGLSLITAPDEPAQPQDNVRFTLLAIYLAFKRWHPAGDYLGISGCPYTADILNQVAIPYITSTRWATLCELDPLPTAWRSCGWHSPSMIHECSKVKVTTFRTWYDENMKCL